MSLTVFDVAEVLGITGLSSEPHHLAEETQKGKDLSKTTLDASVSNLRPFPCGTMTRYPQRCDLGPSNPTVGEPIHGPQWPASLQLLCLPYQRTQMPANFVLPSCLGTEAKASNKTVF